MMIRRVFGVEHAGRGEWAFGFGHAHDAFLVVTFWRWNLLVWATKEPTGG